MDSDTADWPRHETTALMLNIVYLFLENYFCNCGLTATQPISQDFKPPILDIVDFLYFFKTPLTLSIYSETC